MNQFSPEVGSVVTIVTRYRSVFLDKEYDDNTYENVTVLAPKKWMKPDQVKISSDTERMPFRVLSLSNIYSVNGEQVSPAKKTKIDRAIVAGSKGNRYTVMIENGTAISCTCQGFAYRRQCRHLNEVKAEVA